MVFVWLPDFGIGNPKIVPGRRHFPKLREYNTTRDMCQMPTSQTSKRECQRNGSGRSLNFQRHGMPFLVDNMWSVKKVELSWCEDKCHRPDASLQMSSLSNSRIHLSRCRHRYQKSLLSTDIRRLQVNSKCLKATVQPWQWNFWC